MRKILINICIMLCLISSFALVSCDSGLYNTADVLNLYQITKQNQIDETNGENKMFNDSYTIDIKYVSKVYEISNPTTENELNLYALNNVYNPLFSSIFKYVESWNENFFDNSDEDLTGEELTNLYNRLNKLNESLLDLKNSKQLMENELEFSDINLVPAHYITSYIYDLNIVVEKALDFVSYFRDLHISHIFTDDTISSNTVTQSLDDMSLNFARFAYVENIRPFNVINGNSKTCDLALLMEAYISGNSYVKLDLYNQVNIELSSSLVEILDNGANETIKSNARKLLYYCDLLKQKINILDGVMKNLDSYKLLLYRFDVISGGEQTYIQTLNTDQKISYEFLCETEDFIENSYITLLNEFI